MDRLTRLGPLRSAIVLFVLGLSTALAQPPVWFLPVLWIAYPLAFHLILSRAGWAGAWLLIWAFWWGQITGGMYWLGWIVGVDLATYWWVTPFAVLGLPGFLALVQSPLWLAAWWLFLRLRVGTFAALLLFAGAAMIAEGFRGWVFTGLPWGPLGTVWGFHALTLQLAAWIGVFGLTALTTLSAGAPLLILRDRRWRDGLAVTLAPLILLLGFGLWRLGAVQDQAATPTDTVVRLVQPGTNSLIRVPEAERRQRVADLVRLSFPEAAEGGASAADVAIWSESSIQFFIDFYPEELAWLTEQLPDGAQIIAGGLGALPPEGPDPPQPTNTAYFITDVGIQARHDKAHLVPFGEFLPWFVSWIPIPAFSAGSFWQGEGLSTWQPGDLPAVSPLICYEMIFPGAVIRRGGPRPAWMVNISNDGWYGDTSGPRQQFIFARFRAVEEGLPMVRVGGTGISGVIDAAGHVQARTPYGTADVVDVSLPQALPLTPYGRNSRLIFWLIAAGFVLAGLSLGSIMRRK